MEKIILHRNYIIKPEQEKSNIYINFSTQENFTELKIDFSYFPSRLGDETMADSLIKAAIKKYVPEEKQGEYWSWRPYLYVPNIITLCLMKNNGYIGCAHKDNPKQTHIISRESSSSGFIKTPAEKANWQIILNLHAIASPEVAADITVIGIKGEGY